VRKQGVVDGRASPKFHPDLKRASLLASPTDGLLLTPTHREINSMFAFSFEKQKT
jgi:hypothetical protein